VRAQAIPPVPARRFGRLGVQTAGADPRPIDVVADLFMARAERLAHSGSRAPRDDASATPDVPEQAHASAISIDLYMSCENRAQTSSHLLSKHMQLVSMP
jgi:hypothetical protein